MSSPIAKLSKNILDRLLVRVHQAGSHRHRVGILGDELCALIHERDVPVRRGLDIGCGDMSMTRALQQKLMDSLWHGVDLYPLPDKLRDDSAWKGYSRFDGQSLPFPDAHFDVALLCDVLHHADESVRTALFAEALRVARLILVKDHFEYGLYSRTMLRAMDLLGNYGYGVSVPDHYFTPDTFRQLVCRAGGSIISLRVGLRLYEHLGPLKYLLRPTWHFLAVIEKDASVSWSGARPEETRRV